MSEHALRQAWRRADLEVARSLAALCYGKASKAGDAEKLSQSVAVAKRQRHDLAVRLSERSVVQTSPAGETPSQTLEQILHATHQTKTLRPPVEKPHMSLLRQRLSAI